MALFTNKWSFEDRKRDIQFSAVDKNKGSKLIKQFTKIIPTTQCFSTKILNNFLLIKTEKKILFLQQNPPHIVMALMESLAIIFYNLITLKQMICWEIAQIFPAGLLFLSFTSDYNGTAPSLSSLYFYSPIQNISQSIAQNKKFVTNSVFIYKNKVIKQFLLLQEILCGVI
ncbi:hypothetical protein INT80_14960 [Gallibacterium anatis]|uniref:Uncharacterized protein n=1 Tax=Gallibacterium anatis TaxID=750 RepID=A0A930UXP6_9PAST|nr:hypothetical protein [Gallibacterium anatis]